MGETVSRTLALIRKELCLWLRSSAVFGITVFFLLFVSIRFYFFGRFFAMDTAGFRYFFSAFPFAYILVIPVLTMKSWAGERKLGSEDFLFSLPFGEWELVLGKFFSCFTLLSAMIFLTLPVPLTLMPLGYFDSGVIFAEYTGALLFGSSALAIGLFFSSVSKTQVSSFLGTAALLLIFTFSSGSSSVLPPSFSRFINYVSLPFHFESFSRGVLDSRDTAFFLLTAALFLFLNTRVLIFRKWN